MKTIEGRVRPFGSGTEPAFVRIEWPETIDEVEEVLASRYDGDPIDGLLRDSARKALIRVQDEVRNDESWENDYDPPEDPEQLKEWTESIAAEVQARVDEMVSATVLELGTFPGESAAKKKDRLDQARQDPETAEALIAELRERHGL